MHPTGAREDDAERAERAALELVPAVSDLGDRLELELRLRAGVLTGEAAVELDATAEGKVIGDAINTASRIQSIAPPGSVLVDDVTRSVTDRAILYEDAGAHTVKGKTRYTDFYFENGPSSVTAVIVGEGYV